MLSKVFYTSALLSASVLAVKQNNMQQGIPEGAPVALMPCETVDDCSTGEVCVAMHPPKAELEENLLAQRWGMDICETATWYWYYDLSSC